MHSPGINGGELTGQLANPGSPGKMAVKTECVCVYVCVYVRTAPGNPLPIHAEESQTHITHRTHVVMGSNPCRHGFGAAGKSHFNAIGYP